METAPCNRVGIIMGRNESPIDISVEGVLLCTLKAVYRLCGARSALSSVACIKLRDFKAFRSSNDLKISGFF